MFLFRNYNKNSNFAHAMQISQQTYKDFISGRIDSFYATAYAPLLMYAIRTLGDGFSFLAEDCVQDAVFEAYQHRSDFDSNTKFKSYLYRCVHNNAITLIRKSHSHSKYLNHKKNDDKELSFEHNIIEQEVIDMLYSAIESLPEELRTIFEMSFEQGMKNQEIADALQLSLPAVKKRKAKMLEILREKVSDKTLMLLFLFI